MDAVTETAVPFCRVRNTNIVLYTKDPKYVGTHNLALKIGLIEYPDIVGSVAFSAQVFTLEEVQPI